VLKLAVGTCDFTCCQRNHKFGDRIVPCDRGITQTILKTLIDSKIQMLFETNQIQLARLSRCFRQWWTRDGSSLCNSKIHFNSLDVFQCELKWDKNLDEASWTDRAGIPILVYGVAMNEIHVVKEILSLYKNIETDILAWRFPKEGVIEVGIPGHVTCLYGAMCFASPEIVIALLDAGAEPNATDVMGNDAFLASCGFGRLDNVKTWCSRDMNWDVNRVNTRFGASALHLTVFMGQKKLPLLRYLIEKKGAEHIGLVNNSGGSLLHNACENPDADPKVVRYILKLRSTNINYRRYGVFFFNSPTRLSFSLELTC